MNKSHQINPKTTKAKLWHWLLLPLIGSGVITLIKDFEAVCSLHIEGILVNFLLSFTFWMVLGNGNMALIHYMDQKWTWLEHTLKRVLVGVVSMLIYTTVASTLILFVFIEYYLGQDFLQIVEQRGILGVSWIPLLITTIISFWLHGQGFLMAWRQSAIDVERLKTENLKSKFESLKSQINPHFLFNSLNALSALVYESQDDAVKFIHQLSHVYRYVLDHQNEEVVPLSKEMEFLKSYIHLHQIRLGDQLSVTFEEFDPIDPTMYIPPLTLQMLVENAIKHNEISKACQLHISIKKENNTINVSNNCNPLTQPKPDSTGLGLKNITARYELLSQIEVVIEKHEAQFSVSVPILKLEI